MYQKFRYNSNKFWCRHTNFRAILLAARPAPGLRKVCAAA